MKNLTAILSLLGACASLAASIPAGVPAPDGRVKLDVGAYAPGALLHFDGIRNAGADLPHDPLAETWKDLGTAGVDAEFLRVSGDTSAWGTRGYLFQGKSMAKTLQTVNLGRDFTVQEVLDVDCSKQIKGSSNTWPNYFAEVRDNCVFTRDQGSTLELKSDSFGSKTRAYCKSWTGRYFTCIVGPTDIYLTQSTSYENGIARTVSADTGAQAWAWGSSPSGTAQRYVVGTFYAVRVYPRVLTEEELAWNRVVDEFRFRDNVPADYAVVDVRSDARGTLDAAACGTFVLAGAQTFSVGAEVTAADGNVYTNAGYTVETWNAATKTWGAPVESAGASYASDGAAGTRVRLTWLWGLKRGVRAFDADAYAPNDLLLNFDGVFNAGRGMAHDPSATTWKNLGEAGVDATFDPEADDTSFWRANGFYFSGRNYAQLDAEVDPGLQFTIQEALRTGPTPEGVTWPSYFGAPNDQCNLYSYLMFKTDLVTGGASASNSQRPSVSNWGGTYITAGVDHGMAMVTETTTPGTWKGVGFGKAIGPQRWTWGSSLGGGNGGKTARYMRGTVFSVRLYARNLTARDIVRNREVDEVRFRGVVPADAVVVRTAVPGVEADDFCGVYQLVGGASKTFTQPARATDAAGCEWAADGCKVEIWDAAKQVWGDAQTAASYTFTQGAAAPKARITWMWRPVRGLKAAYDVGDYVQDGLIGHWDGIRNVGPDQPHSADAKFWVDLGGLVHDADWKQLNMSTLNPGTVDLANDTGAWTDDGFAFAGYSWFATRGALNFGRRATIQIVCDFVPSKQLPSRSTTNGAPWPTLFGQKGDNGNLYTGGTGSELNFKCDNVNGSSYNNNRARLPGFQGKYVNAMVDYDATALFQTSQKPAKFITTGVFKNEIGAQVWSWGSTDHGNTNSMDRCMVGTIHAVRIYDRILTDVELAHNRAVDENRFRGAGIAATNVVVASRASLAEGSEPNGAYEVDGEWTFTAAPVTVPREGRKDLVLTPTGYTLETWSDGAWGAPAAYTGTNYTYVATATAAPVRLTWTWSRNDGMMVIIR